MAVDAKISQLPKIDFRKESVVSKVIDRKFGRPEDYIEVHIYNQNDQLLTTISNFTDFTTGDGSTLTNELN